MDLEGGLTPWRRQLLHAYRHLGAATIVVVITAISVVLSVTAVATTLLALAGTREDWLPALVLAALIPGVVAPTASTLIVRLLGTIVETRDRLEEMASTDSLTGLANRRRFFAVAEQFTAERLDGEVVMLGLSDMNDFKAINDSHGHAVGDAALQQLARHLARAVDGDGLAARLGGDEFACVVRVPAERWEAIRTAVVTACSEIRFADELRLAACVGFSEIDGSGDVDAALSRADLALYMQKSELKRRRGEGAPTDTQGLQQTA